MSLLCRLGRTIWKRPLLHLRITFNPLTLQHSIKFRIKFRLHYVVRIYTYSYCDINNTCNNGMIRSVC